MAHTAYLPIIADRYGAVVRHIFVVGLDLTGIDMRAQVRLYGDVPGAPLVDLLTVANGNAQGLRLVEVTSDDAGLPTSHIELVINETTMEALPYAGEIGDVTTLAWDWQITIAGRKRRLAKGEFQITGDGVTGAEVAPINRIQPYGLPQRPVADVWSTARMTFGEEQVTVQIDGADLIAPFAKKASDAADSAEADATLAGLAAASAQAVTRYFTTRAAGEAASTVDQAFATDDGAGNVIYYRRTAGGSVEIGRAVTPASLQGAAGARLIGYRRSSVGSVLIDLDRRLNELPLTAAEFGIVADFDRVTGVGTDNTVALQKMLDEAGRTGRPMQLPPGRILITDELVSTKAFKTRTSGPGTTELVMVSSTIKALIRVICPDNSSIIGLDVTGIRLVCDGFGRGVNCDGIVLVGTAINSAFHSCYVRDNEIANPRIGISIDAVFYRCVVQNNTIGPYFGGKVTGHGIYADSTHDITYNDFLFNEVTGLSDGAWAFYIHSNYSLFLGNTCEGYSYYSSPGGRVFHSTEHLTSIGPSVYGKNVVWLNQVAFAEINLRYCGPDKADTGVRITGACDCSIAFEGPEPAHPVLLDGGSRGILRNITRATGTSKIEDTHSDETLSSWTLLGCQQVSNRSFVNAQGTWVPTFPGWTTAPTVIAARWKRHNDTVRVSLVLDGGQIAIGGSISLPPDLSATAAEGSTATIKPGAAGAPAMFGIIAAGATSISGLPAATLTGVTFVTAEYRLQ